MAIETRDGRDGCVVMVTSSGESGNRRKRACQVSRYSPAVTEITWVADGDMIRPWKITSNLDRSHFIF